MTSANRTLSFFRMIEIRRGRVNTFKRTISHLLQQQRTRPTRQRVATLLKQISISRVLSQSPDTLRNRQVGRTFKQTPPSTNTIATTNLGSLRNFVSTNNGIIHRTRRLQQLRQYTTRHQRINSSMRMLATGRVPNFVCNVRRPTRINRTRMVRIFMRRIRPNIILSSPIRTQRLSMSLPATVNDDSINRGARQITSIFRRITRRGYIDVRTRFLDR